LRTARPVRVGVDDDGERGVRWGLFIAAPA
jgi:hypothetical protein